MDQSRGKFYPSKVKILKQNLAAKDLVYAKRTGEQNFAKLKISDPTRYQEINFAKFNAACESDAKILPPRAWVYFKTSICTASLLNFTVPFYRAAVRLRLLAITICF